MVINKGKNTIRLKEASASPQYKEEEGQYVISLFSLAFFADFFLIVEG